MKKIVIIPAYNEEGGIVKTVTDVMENAKDFDYVVINDCSKDNTLEICHEHNFNVVNIPVNMGIGGGVQTGYMYAYRNGYDIAVQFDGDGQHNASYLDSMSKKLVEENLDMVIGSRYIEKEGFQSSGMRRMGIKYFTGLIKLLTGKKIGECLKKASHEEEVCMRFGGDEFIVLGLENVADGRHLEFEQEFQKNIQKIIRNRRA